MGIEGYVNELEFSVVNIQFIMQFFLTVILLSFILLSIGYYLYIEKMNLVLFMMAYSLVLMINQFAYSVLQITTIEADQALWLHVVYASKATSVFLLILTTFVILRYRVFLFSLLNFGLYLISFVLLFVLQWPRIIVVGYTGISLVCLLITLCYLSHKDLISNMFLIRIVKLYFLYFIIDEIIYTRFTTSFSIDWFVISLVLLVLVVFFLRRYKQILQEKINLYDKLIIDELTGNYSKAYFNEFLEDKYSGYLMMIDINNFKSVNDIYGHIVGDKLLASLGEILRNNENNGILASRIGGDEFMIYTPNVIEGSMKQLSKKIIEEFSNVITFNDLSDVVGLGLSIGITKVDESSKLIILEKVDANMYVSKKIGNNHITVK